MRLRGLKDLPGQLATRLLPVYLITGDEPQQMMEAGDLVRKAAREWGAAEREVFEVDASFDWGRLNESSNTLSLFGDRRIIELRIPNGKPGREGGAALSEYAQQLPEDSILLITMGKVDHRSQSSKWFTGLDKVGAILQVWPVDIKHLPRWIEDRMRQKGLEPGPEVARLLSERVEGNLLAAAQEVDKLLLLHGSGHIDLQTVQSAVGNSARFDVFALVDAALQGDVARTAQMLQSIKGEGVAAPVVLWALVRELRVLAHFAQGLAQGQNLDGLFRTARVWEKRKALIRNALSRHSLPVWQGMIAQAARADRVVKGAESGDPWDELLQLALRLSGHAVLSASGKSSRH